MSKIEIFLPLPGMTAAMDAHFSAGNVIRPFGLPTGPELPADDLTEQELLEIGLEAAEDKMLELNRSSAELHTVVADSPFIGEFTDAAGTLIGWEFEFMVFSQPWE